MSMLPGLDSHNWPWSIAFFPWLDGLQANLGHPNTTAICTSDLKFGSVNTQQSLVPKAIMESERIQHMWREPINKTANFFFFFGSITSSLDDAFGIKKIQKVRFFFLTAQATRWFPQGSASVVKGAGSEYKSDGNKGQMISTNATVAH